MIRTKWVRRLAAVLMSALVLQAGGLPYFSSSADAADGRRVAVLPFVLKEGAPWPAHEKFRGLVEEELKTRDGLLVVAPPGGEVKARAPVKEGPPKEALRALEEGQAKLSDLRFDAAAKALKEGIRLLTERPQTLDHDRLTEAYVSLAVALFRMGEEDGAQKALSEVARLHPKYRLPDGKYPPIFVREFEKARRRADRAVKGTVAVDGPPGATVFVDGEDLGMVPVIQDNLAAGAHYVKVEGTRGELFGEVVTVGSGTARVKARFERGPASAGTAAREIGPLLDEVALAGAARACEAAGADYAVVGVIYRSDDHQLTAATAVFSLHRKGFVPLKTYVFDEELLTANVEAFKLADDVADLVGDFRRPPPLPVDLAKGATYRVAAADRTRPVEVARDGERRALTGTERPVLVPEEDPEEQEVRAFDRPSVTAGAELPEEGPEVGPKSEGLAWWVWTLVGVGVAAAAGGTYYGVSQATRPVTGTITAQW